MSIFDEVETIAKHLGFKAVIDHKNENECFAVIHDGCVKTYHLRDAHIAPASKNTHVVTTHGPLAIIFFQALAGDPVWICGEDGNALKVLSIPDGAGCKDVLVLVNPEAFKNAEAAAYRWESYKRDVVPVAGSNETFLKLFFPESWKDVKEKLWPNLC